MTRGGHGHVQEGPRCWIASALEYRPGGCRSVTCKATANAATKTIPASFGINIAGTPTSGQPALPNSSPITLSRGRGLHYLTHIADAPRRAREISSHEESNRLTYPWDKCRRLDRLAK